MAKRNDITEYNRKRDFKKTREPAGKRAAKSAGNRFVVHEHHATRLHWDLRLEHDGALASWAIPNGIPPDPKENRLAVHVEDHPLEYIDFSGEIPEGQYGAGLVKIWDEGTYVEEKFRKDEVIVTFDGERLRGKYVLFQTKGDDWMIHRMDPPEFERDPMPKVPEPMLATPAKRAPSGRGWAYELDWQGERALFRWQPGRASLINAAGENVLSRFPEVRPLGPKLGSLEAILDGELVAIGDDGRPSRELLEERLALTSKPAIKRAAEMRPLAYMVFDVLYLDGRDVTALPYDDRWLLLDEIGFEGGAFRIAPSGTEGIAAMRKVAAGLGLPGVVAKRLDSVYAPGRTSDWLAVR